jgi:hypothetical protein
MLRTSHHDATHLVQRGGQHWADANPSGALRMTFFEGDSGTIIYVILEDQRRVDVIDVWWMEIDIRRTQPEEGPGCRLQSTRSARTQRTPSAQPAMGAVLGQQATVVTDDRASPGKRGRKVVTVMATEDKIQPVGKPCADVGL